MITSQSFTAKFLVSLYNRRGVIDDKVFIFDQISEKETTQFEIELDNDEELAIAISSSEQNNASWLTNKRFIWECGSYKKEFFLSDIADVNLFVIDGELPEHALAIRISAKDKKEYEIRMPNTGVLNGFLAIFKKIVLG